MKEILKTSVSLFLRLIIVGIMCAIVTVSITVIADGFFAKQIGYTATGVKEGGKESENLYTYYYSDGEDTQKEGFTNQGYEITEHPIKKLSKKGDIITLIVAQLFCFILTSSFIYPNIWHMGTKDSNLVKFKHANTDKLKGLKIGLLTIIPSVLILLFLFITKGSISAKVPIALYKLLNAPFYGFISLAVGKTVAFGDISFFKFLLLFIIQLLIPAVACALYLLGFNNISVSEKLIYKKNKE